MPLTGEQLDKVKLVLMSPGWNDVIRPALENRGRSAIKALCLTRAERAKVMAGQPFDTDDDVLRAMIREAEWMIAIWANEVSVDEHNRRLDELDRQGVAGSPGANP
jgi:hypothetical protein